MAMCFLALVPLLCTWLPTKRTLLDEHVQCMHIKTTSIAERVMRDVLAGRLRISPGVFTFCSVKEVLQNHGQNTAVLWMLHSEHDKAQRQLIQGTGQNLFVRGEVWIGVFRMLSPCQRAPAWI